MSEVSRAVLYDAFLHSHRWQEIRVAVFKRDRNQCQGCLRELQPLALQVHHYSYRYGFDPPMWVLVTVCKDCHKRLHAGKYGLSDEWDCGNGCLDLPVMGA